MFLKQIEPGPSYFNNQKYHRLLFWSSRNRNFNFKNAHFDYRCDEEFLEVIKSFGIKLRLGAMRHFIYIDSFPNELQGLLALNTGVIKAFEYYLKIEELDKLIKSIKE